jgi:hypothetical protein
MNAPKMDGWFWIALGFFLLNILNLALWSIHGYVSAYLYLAGALVFVLYSLKHLDRSWAVLCLFILFSVIILGGPVSAWDARSIWFFHAKRIFFDDNLYAQLDHYAPWSHNDYPILVPAVAASLAKGVGYWNEVFPRLSLLCVLLPIFLVFRSLLPQNDLYHLWLVGVLLLCSPLGGTSNLLNGYMDSILALYFSAASLLLAGIYLNGDISPKVNYILLGALVATLPLIKNEGLLASAVILAALVPRLKKEFWKCALVCLAILPYGVLWKYQVHLQRIPTDLFTAGILQRGVSRLTHPGELFLIAKHFLNSSGIYVLLLGIVFVRFVEKKRAWIPSVFAVLLYGSAILFVYMITPMDLQWHLEKSAGRTFLAVNLSIFSLGIYYLADPARKPLSEVIAGFFPIKTPKRN